MKKNLMAIIIVSFASIQSSSACDICGCGVSNYNPFLFPHLSKSYISLSWYHRLYYTHSESGVSGRETYNSLLVTGQYSPLKKLKLTAIFPYQINKLDNDNGLKNRNGLGDLTLLANYTVFDRTFGNLRHTIIAGAGVQLPTGKYEAAQTEDIDDQNFQLGTGSTDYLLNISYQLSYRNWVLSTATSYKYNSQNKDSYRYGDVLTNGATLVYRKECKRFSIVPYLQLINETQMKDANKHILQDHSGGNVLYSGGGLDINTRLFTIGSNYQFAAKQKLAEGQINVKPRFFVHLSFTL